MQPNLVPNFFRIRVASVLHRGQHDVERRQRPRLDGELGEELLDPRVIRLFALEGRQQLTDLAAVSLLALQTLSVSTQQISSRRRARTAHHWPRTGWTANRTGSWEGPRRGCGRKFDQRLARLTGITTFSSVALATELTGLGTTPLTARRPGGPGTDPLRPTGGRYPSPTTGLSIALEALHPPVAFVVKLGVVGRHFLLLFWDFSRGQASLLERSHLLQQGFFQTLRHSFSFSDIGGRE